MTVVNRIYRWRTTEALALRHVNCTRDMGCGIQNGRVLQSRSAAVSLWSQLRGKCHMQAMAPDSLCL